MSVQSHNFYFQRDDGTGNILNYQSSCTYQSTDPNFKWNEITLPFKTIGYYTNGSYKQTLAFTLRNFIGRIKVFATLDNTITDNSVWFPIKLNTPSGYYMEPRGRGYYMEPSGYYMEFGTNVYGETQLVGYYGTTGTFCEVITGNYCYLKVAIERDYISDQPDDLIKQYVGCIEQVLINL